MLELKRLDGSPTTLKGELEGKPALIALWATWCETCATEFDALGRLDARATERGATVRLFDSKPDLSGSVLVLAPHPDDAEIAAFGLYANRKSTVVTVTAGNAGAPTYEAVFDDPSEHYLFKGRIRLIDSITVPLQGGIPPERALFLDDAASNVAAAEKLGIRSVLVRSDLADALAALDALLEAPR